MSAAVAASGVRTPPDGVWRIWVDTGGTFTDCVARAPDGDLRRAKVLSHGALRTRVRAARGGRELEIDPLADLPDGFFDGWTLRAGGEPVGEVAASAPQAGGLTVREPLAAGPAAGETVELFSGEPSPVVAARLVSGTPLGAELPPIEMRLATTRGTNALLERRGARIALFITRGFSDLLRIGNQQRPDLFALRVERPQPLYEAVEEVDERLDASGAVERPLDTDRLAAAADALVARGIRVAAVALLHSYRNPAHEERVARFLAERGFEHVTRSADGAPRIQIVPRAETAVVDAYLARAVGGYLATVRSALGGATLHVMTSAGGLQRAELYRPKDSLLSGPAGGVVGAAAAARQSGRSRIVAFDMGGTSTDVSRHDGEFDYRFETRVGAVRLLAPALAIETVAAGGGSICGFDGHRLRVGPESAGAEPGPACYGAGGPLCLTDVNLLLGRLRPERFEIPVDRPAAEEAAGRLEESLGRRGGDREGLLAGLLRIADERMAAAVRQISLREGYRPGDHALVAFGGAGPQHACALAELLGMREVLIPADASLLSAIGLSAARVERFAERQVLLPLSEAAQRVTGWLEELAAKARAEVIEEGIPADRVDVRLRRVEMRLAGQDATLAVEPGDDLEAAFRTVYAETFGYPPPQRPIEVESLRVVASSREQEELGAGGPPEATAAEPDGSASTWCAGAWRNVPVYPRERLVAGARGSGPALVVERHTTTWIAPRWRFAVDSAGALVLGREGVTG